MGKVKVKINHAGARELLRSEEMKSICEAHANNAVAKLGAGYKATSWTGKGRVNASVAAVSPMARAENLKDNTILKAVRSS